MARYFDSFLERIEYENDELLHYGVKGMKWGIRRYQPYPDGSAGKFLGKKKKSSKRIRAERAREEADLAKKLAKGYVNKMEKKAQKRKRQADEYDQKKKKKADERERRAKELREYGKKEDQMPYKYNKPGEKGTKGFRRAIGSLGESVYSSKEKRHKRNADADRFYSDLLKKDIKDLNKKSKAQFKNKQYVRGTATKLGEAYSRYAKNWWDNEYNNDITKAQIAAAKKKKYGRYKR